jgi:uncharacterized protein
MERQSMAAQGRLLESQQEVQGALGGAKRIAVVGIKPESHASTAAHYVPSYLKRAGYEVIPVPVYYPEVTEILGAPVYRKLTDVPGDIDMVVLFRRSQDVPQHVDDIIAKGAKTVWMQSGIEHPEAARRLTEAGIDVVQDRCAMVEHRSI